MISKETLDKADGEARGLIMAMAKHIEEHDIDGRIALAGVIGWLSIGISSATGNDVAKQDYAIDMIRHGIMLSLCENGFRETIYDKSETN